jgi:hypothetical protein
MNSRLFDPVLKYGAEERGGGVRKSGLEKPVGHTFAVRFVGKSAVRR